MKHDFDSGTIYHGDCLEIMPELSGPVDMILADLPYGTTACHWDSIIPFEPLWENYKRLIKPSGAIVLTASQPFTSALVMSNADMFRYDLIYEKSHAVGFLNANKMPMRNHENILIFYNKLPVYNAQISDKEKSNIRKFSDRDFSGDSDRQSDNYGSFKNGVHRKIGIDKSYPKSIIRFKTYKNKTIHPTQKPVKLFEYLIRTYTNEGDTVLDNTIGSGTTAVAAHNTKRKWIGIEKDEAIYESAVARIKRDTAQLNLF